MDIAKNVEFRGFVLSNKSGVTRSLHNVKYLFLRATLPADPHRCITSSLVYHSMLLILTNLLHSLSLPKLDNIHVILKQTLSFIIIVYQFNVQKHSLNYPISAEDFRYTCTPFSMLGGPDISFC